MAMRYPPIMKKTATVLGAAVLASLTACADLDESVISGVTGSTLYPTTSGYEQLVWAAYSPLRRFYGHDNGWYMTTVGTDAFTKGSDGSNNKVMNDYTPLINPGMAMIGQVWTDLYEGINIANAVIGRAPTAAVSAAIRDRRVAEGKFLRALYYFNLVQQFGDVHLTLEETRGVETEAARTPVAQVYDQIIEDLLAAEVALTYQPDNVGRAHRGAVQHLLAKVYLTRAGSGDMARAAEYAKKVIDSGNYNLLPRFEDVFDITNQQNVEVIWSVQYSSDPLAAGEGNRGHLLFLMEYDVLPGMRRDIANGRPFKNIVPTQFLLDLYDREKDSRYHGSFRTAWHSNNAATIPRDANGTPRFAVGDTAIWLAPTEVSAAFRASKPYRIYTPTQYTDRVFPPISKFHDPLRPTIAETRGQRDFFVMRLAETYLIAAEALMRDGKSMEAVQYVNMVRRRAAYPGREAAMEVTAAQLDIDFILDERARELAGEGHNWHDLVRTGKLIERVRAHNRQAAPNILPFHVLRPIPQAQIDRTSTPFAQNPGY
jgi:starch-binding outer membrane protein, SusD/RagB family